jgi:Tfp pilus assembly protein PilO
MDFLRDKKLIAGASFMVVAAAILFFFDLTYWAKIKSTQDEIEKVRQQIVLAQDLLGVINDLSTTFGNLNQQADRIQVALPSRAQIPEVLVQLSSLTAQNGLVLRNISFSTKENTSGGAYSPVVISLQLAGNYEALKTFLVALEQNLRIFDVEFLNFSVPREPGRVPEFGLSIVTYYQ